jgi:hypothetical protein
VIFSVGLILDTGEEKNIKDKLEEQIPHSSQGPMSALPSEPLCCCLAEAKKIVTSAGHGK